MLLMCNETVIRRMFKRDPAKFTDKIWDFAVKAGGAVGRKIKRFMKSEEYAKILINKATRNWPEPDANESREIKRYIRMAKFSQILKSDKHRRNVDNKQTTLLLVPKYRLLQQQKDRQHPQPQRRGKLYQ